MTDSELMERSLEELRTHLEKHRQLMTTILEGRDLPANCVWSDCHHQQILLNMIVETVQILDETRKSFKSKQLEQLRKRLLAVLNIETSCKPKKGLMQLTQ